MPDATMPGANPGHRVNFGSDAGRQTAPHHDQAGGYIPICWPFSVAQKISAISSM